MQFDNKNIIFLLHTKPKNRCPPRELVFYAVVKDELDREMTEPIFLEGLDAKCRKNSLTVITIDLNETNAVFWKSKGFVGFTNKARCKISTCGSVLPPLGTLFFIERAQFLEDAHGQVTVSLIPDVVKFHASLSFSVRRVASRTKAHHPSCAGSYQR